MERPAYQIEIATFQTWLNEREAIEDYSLFSVKQIEQSSKNTNTLDEY